jgi:hypothetical protein
MIKKNLCLYFFTPANHAGNINNTLWINSLKLLLSTLF